MPDFQGTDDILVQPNDLKVPYTFTFTVCSSATTNDGALPYNTNISSVLVSSHTQDGTADTELVFSTALATNIVTLTLSYPATNGPGTYHLRFICTLDTAAKIEFDFNRIYVKDQ